MKNIISSLILLSSLTAVSALAEVEVAPSRCDAILRLSDSQKLEIKEIKKVSAQKLRTLGLEIKKAKLAADTVLLKVEASKEEAVVASQSVASKISEIQNVQAAEKIAVLFDVLTAEQRIKKLKCEKALVHPRRGQVGQRPLPPHRPGRIEPRPAPHHRPGGRVIVRPAPGRHPQGPVRPGRGPVRPGRGGIVRI